MTCTVPGGGAIAAAARASRSPVMVAPAAEPVRVAPAAVAVDPTASAVSPGAVAAPGAAGDVTVPGDVGCEPACRAATWAVVTPVPGSAARGASMSWRRSGLARWTAVAIQAAT
ncbi:hypothetical protein SDC9_83286 [bioreactor metagenome]|uniref:Uncharacterized protein n=1 Tax=bioreactor metagenome TaxID=1076179 RepID=A0A644Z763_9ZZZZ